MKVLFVCSAGMSSAIIVSAFKKEATKHGQEVEVKAIASSEIEQEVENGWDIIMVAPQVRHKLDSIQKVAEQHNIPCEAIPPQGYTPLGGPILWRKVIETLQK